MGKVQKNVYLSPEEENDDLRLESVMMQGDSDQHIPCLVAKEINCGPRRSRIP